MDALAKDDPALLDVIRGRPKPFESAYGLGRTGVAGLALGFVGGAHAAALGLVACGALAWPAFAARWCCYVVALTSFHAAEFLTTAAYKWRDLSYDSWLLNHSRAYTLAAFAACAEFWLEVSFAPGLKALGPLFAAGLCLVVLGHGARVLAMVTCGEHFAHRIATSRPEGHELVTTGIYRYLRHPSYTGWFWWSVGTQLVLGNPLCFVAYACASYSFFADRIPFEEETLRDFYPREYPAYAARTFVLIPFLRAR